MQHDTTIPELTVVKAGEGDSDARAQLYNQYSKAMYNICIRMTGNRNDAEDILQDTFIYAFNKLRQLKEPAAFGGWLRRIIINQCIRFSKKNIRWSALNEEDTDTIADEETEWWVNIPLALVHEEIKNLPNGCRQVFVLFAMENFGHKKIAESLAVSESTSKSQYQRARKLLKERITKRMDIHG